MPATARVLTLLVAFVLAMPASPAPASPATAVPDDVGRAAVGPQTERHAGTAESGDWSVDEMSDPLPQE